MANLVNLIQSAGAGDLHRSPEGARHAARHAANPDELSTAPHSTATAMTPATDASTTQLGDHRPGDSAQDLARPC